MALLTCLDFSEASLTSIRYAAHLARDLDQPMTIVHCLETDLVDKLWSIVGRNRQTVRRDVRAKMETAYRQAVPTDERPENVTFEISEKDAVSGILDLADTGEFSMVVMGATGRGALENLTLGSTGDAVARSCGIPTLIVPAGSAPTEFEHVLAPVDDSRESSVSLEKAIELAETWGAKLIIHHAFVLPAAGHLHPTDEAPPDGIEELEESRWDSMETFLEAFDFGDLETQTIFRLENPYHSIVDAIEDYDIDLLVMGTRAERGVTRLIHGSNASKLLRKPPVPLMIVKQPPVE